MSATLLPLPRFMRHPTVASLHRAAVERMSTMWVPGDQPYDLSSTANQAAGLRDNAQYLAELHRNLQPIVARVAELAADFTGCKDTSDIAGIPLESLDDAILSAMRAHADLLEEDAQGDLFESRRVG